MRRYPGPLPWNIVRLDDAHIYPQLPLVYGTGPVSNQENSLGSFLLSRINDNHDISIEAILYHDKSTPDLAIDATATTISNPIKARTHGTPHASNEPIALTLYLSLSYAGLTRQSTLQASYSSIQPPPTISRNVILTTVFSDHLSRTLPSAGLSPV